MIKRNLRSYSLQYINFSSCTRSQ